MPAIPLTPASMSDMVFSQSHPLYISAHTFTKRQQQINTIAIPTIYSGLDSGPDPGAVVGITLGSVAAFLLITWLLVTLAGGSGGGSVVGEEEVIVRRERSHRSRRSEIREISRSPRPARIVVEERQARTVPVVVEDRGSRRDGDDVVEVIEEHTPPRRKKGHRSSGYRSVDPNAYAGGNYPQHSVGSRRYS